MNTVWRALPAFLLVIFVSACNMPGREAEPAEEIMEFEEIVIMPTDLPDGGERDACLLGGWTMHTPEVDILVATLVPLPNLRVPSGNLTMIFDEDGTYTYLGDLIVRIDLRPEENNYMEGEGGFTTRGAYSTSEGMLNLDFNESEREVFVWRAYKGDQSNTVPGGGPDFSLNPPGSAPYRCTANLLEIDTIGPGGTVTMFFQR